MVSSNSLLKSDSLAERILKETSLLKQKQRYLYDDGLHRLLVLDFIYIREIVHFPHPGRVTLTLTTATLQHCKRMQLNWSPSSQRDAIQHTFTPIRPRWRDKGSLWGLHRGTLGKYRRIGLETKRGESCKGNRSSVKCYTGQQMCMYITGMYLQ